MTLLIMKITAGIFFDKCVMISDQTMDATGLDGLDTWKGEIKKYECLLKEIECGSAGEKICGAWSTIFFF